jgi:hypothetical protein
MSESELFPRPPDQQDGPRRPERRKNNYSLLVIIATIFIGVIAGAIGRACGTGLAWLSGPPKPITLSVPPEMIWNNYSLPGTSVSLEMPGEASQVTAEPPPELNDILVHYANYELNHGEILVLLNHMEFVAINLKINTVREASVRLENFKESSTVNDLEYLVNNTGPSESVFRGSLKLNDKPSELNGFVRANGLKTWFIVCINIRDSIIAPAACKRVLKSVVIN